VIKPQTLPTSGLACRNLDEGRSGRILRVINALSMNKQFALNLHILFACLPCLQAGRRQAGNRQTAKKHAPDLIRGDSAKHSKNLYL